MQCLQYKTDQQSDLRKLEKLNLQMLALMATGEAPAGASSGAAAQQTCRLLGTVAVCKRRTARCQEQPACLPLVPALPAPLCSSVS